MEFLKQKPVLVLLLVLNTGDLWDHEVVGVFPDVDFGIQAAMDLMDDINNKSMAGDGPSPDTSEPVFKLVRGSDNVTEKVVRVWKDDDGVGMYRLERVPFLVPKNT